MKYLQYIFWTLLIIVPCLFTILIYNDKITQNSPIYYRQGVQFYNDGNYADAFYNFSKIKRISPLYAMALYKQAKSAQKIGDYKTAALKYDLFLKKMPESVFSTNARLNLAKSYYYLKQYDNARIEFEKLEQNNNLSTDEIFFLGLIERNYDIEKAAQYFRKYLDIALNEENSGKYYVIGCAKELSSLGIELSNDDMKLIGIAYFNEHKYQEALEYFSKLPVEICWDYLVLANHYSGSKVIAKKLIEEGFKTYAKHAEENKLNEIYNIYVSYLSGNRLKNWQQIEKLVRENKLKGIDYVFYKLAEISPREKSVVYYREIYQNYQKSRYAAEALWNLIWYAYKKNDYISVEKLSLKHLKIYKKVNSTPKVIFWLGKTYLKQNKIQEAHNVFNKLITRYPDDYYGLRAASILGKKNDFWETSKNNKLPTDKAEIDFPISTADVDIKDLKLINTLFNMGDYEVWLDADFTNPIVESWFEFKKGKKSRSIVLARDEISKMEIKAPVISAVYKLAYPVYMTKEINISGEKLEIDPFLIASIIREESYYNENARSRTGAIGLMQLMPQTANYMLNRLNVSNTADIEDIRTNLYLGSNYLKYLKDKFNNDLYVVTAYNGGEGAAGKWTKKFNGEDYDEFIEDIPYDETRNYVKKVFRTYQMYKKIYK